MKRQWILAAGLALSMTAAWAQRGGGAGNHGAGMGAGQSMPAAASHANTGSKNANSGSAASNHGATSAANGAAVADRITANNGLSSKVQALLPSGMTLQTASTGFKNMGQFIAALHVSKNLNIPFDQLQKKMSSGKSLGQAIRVLSPNTTKDQVKTDVKTAENQAKDDVDGSKAAKSGKRNTSGA